MNAARPVTLTVPLRGGFANQLFLWAAAERVREATGCRVEFDARLVERPGDRGEQLSPLGVITAPRMPRALARRAWRALAALVPAALYAHVNDLLPVRPFVHRAASVERAIARIRDGRPVVLDGYVQDTLAVAWNRTALSSALAARLPDVRHLVGNAPYAAVHVRRGDYVSDPTLAAKFGVPSLEYYVGGIRRIGELPVKVVSDDVRWVRDELLPATRGDIRIVSGTDHFEDFAVLVGARSLVLSNSTYSWWAAMGGDHDAVVAPSPWMDSPDEPGLHMPDWIRLGKHSGELAA